MNDNLKYFLIAFGGNAVLLTLLAFLLKSIIKHFLSKDIESFKSELSHSHDKELSEFKSLLEKASIEHQISYSTIYSKQAEVYSLLYEKLYELQNFASCIVAEIEFSEAPGPEEKAKRFSEAFKNVKEVFLKNRLFFPDDLDKKIEHLILTINGSISKYNFSVRAQQKPSQQNRIEKWIEREENARDIIESQIPPLFNDIKMEFKKILKTEKIPTKTCS